MHILLTGATGLIGGHLVPALLDRGHTLSLWARTPEAAKARWPAVNAGATLEQLGNPATIDLAINLAGEPIAGGRWRPARKQALRASRIDLTHTLCQWLAQAPRSDRLLLSGSAVGIYGHAGSTELNEQSVNLSEDFASQLCRDWEQSALLPGCAGRTVLLRTGLVLSTQGGLLAQMRIPFSLGLGGRLGSGEQYMPWIHWQDYVNALLFIIDTPALSGPVNLTAPAPVTNAAFTRALASQLHRPACLPAPAPLLRLVLGELSELMLYGQRALPEKLLAAGFEFRFAQLDAALQDLL